MTKSIKEKVFGAVYGYAIGDALGLGTEFMTRKEAARYYPNGLSDYSQIIRDAHRSQWKRGDISTDTKIVGVQIESLADNKGINYIDLARRYRDLYDKENVDLTTNLRWVISQPNYQKDPFGTTRAVWNGMKKFEASNECLGRALFVGMWNEDLPATAIKYCQLTHPHPRCEAASAIIAQTAASLMWKNDMPSFETLVALARELNSDVVRYLEAARFGTLEDFRLDERDTLWFVRKTMGCALWALWHCSSPEEGLFAIINQGGDADTNAALTEGLLGIKYGFSALPKHLVDGLTEKEYIEHLAILMTSLLEEREK
ncbi:MAG: ADP-ribosylglycohydrolase family protein [Muribaculaceae bacterium]|nr:ADP-ribosylglycohydrolase family protein [Muribaculaceae bacterium]